MKNVARKLPYSLDQRTFKRKNTISIRSFVVIEQFVSYILQCAENLIYTTRRNDVTSDVGSVRRCNVLQLAYNPDTIKRILELALLREI